mmetsp:Transcript_108404/g.349952  ORF Transcript_108404/g.349952 Transcript_108404/m.349952 type:complete len:211 (+) Transcript_108404:874-1506(+)
MGVYWLRVHRGRRRRGDEVCKFIGSRRRGLLHARRALLLPALVDDDRHRLHHALAGRLDLLHAAYEPGAAVVEALEERLAQAHADVLQAPGPGLPVLGHLLHAPAHVRAVGVPALQPLLHQAVDLALAGPTQVHLLGVRVPEDRGWLAAHLRHVVRPAKLQGWHNPRLQGYRAAQREGPRWDWGLPAPNRGFLWWRGWRRRAAGRLEGDA